MITLTGKVVITADMIILDGLTVTNDPTHKLSADLYAALKAVLIEANSEAVLKVGHKFAVTYRVEYGRAVDYDGKPITGSIRVE